MEKVWINGQLYPANLADTKPYVAAELKRQRKFKRDAKELGFEVITPEAAMSLFGISAPAVRQARLGGHVDVAFTLDVTGKAVHVLKLQSAAHYWHSKKRPEFDDELERMREAGHMMGVRGLPYLILHVRPIFNWSDDVLAE